MEHPLLEEIKRICESNEVPVLLVDSLFIDKHGPGTLGTLTLTAGGTLWVHRYGEDISQTEDRTFGDGATARDVLDFVLGFEPEPGEGAPQPGLPHSILPTEGLSLEQRVDRLEMLFTVLAEDKQQRDEFVAATRKLLGVS